MAVKSSNSSGKRKGLISGALSSTPPFLSNIIKIITVIFVVLCLFGFINQLATGQAFFDWLTSTGRRTGEVMTYIFTGKEETPVNVTDQGIYVKGYEPEGSKKVEFDKVDTPSNTENKDEQNQNQNQNENENENTSTVNKENNNNKGSTDKK